MRPASAIALMFMIPMLFVPSHSFCEGGESSAEIVQWKFHSDTGDGRRFLTDGSLLLDSRYVPDQPIPEKSVPSQTVQRLLESNTDHEFGFADLSRREAGDYMAPGSIQLNRKYIDYLQKTRLKASLRFRARGPNDPVLVLDGDKVVGVVMPMKSSRASRVDG